MPGHHVERYYIDFQCQTENHRLPFSQFNPICKPNLFSSPPNLCKPTFPGVLTLWVFVNFNITPGNKDFYYYLFIRFVNSKKRNSKTSSSSGRKSRGSRSRGGGSSLYRTSSYDDGSSTYSSSSYGSYGGSPSQVSSNRRFVEPKF